MNIFLIGPRASGKTSAGRLLAEKLGADFVDTDQRFVETRRMEIAEMVEKEGWAAFRLAESGLLKEISRPAGLRVVATGGGLVLAEANRRLMRAEGQVFYLSAPAEILAARLAADPLAPQRPSLTGRDPLEEVAEVLAQREELYRQTAHHRVDAARPPEQVAADILSLIR